MKHYNLINKKTSEVNSLGSLSMALAEMAEPTKEENKTVKFENDDFRIEETEVIRKKRK